MDDSVLALLFLLLVISSFWLIPLIRKKILSLFKGWIGEKRLPSFCGYRSVRKYTEDSTISSFLQETVPLKLTTFLYHHMGYS